MSRARARDDAAAAGATIARAPLDMRLVLPGEATVADALARLAGRPEGVVVVRDEGGAAGGAAGDGTGHAAARAGGAGARALLDIDLRFAAQDGDPALPLAALAAPSVLADDEDSARRRLADDRRQAAAVVPARGGTFLLVQRVREDVTTAVVMAGGLGLRLRPLTEDVPKPLVDVGGRPLLFRTLEALAGAGVRRVLLSVNYLAERIERAVGDGRAFGVAVEYLREDEPLGTGAGLSQMLALPEPFLLVNGDILTDLDYRALARRHVLTGALCTVATTLHATAIPYGVVHGEGERLVSIEEKPTVRRPVNAGIYAFAPAVHALVGKGRPLGLVDFLNALLAEGWPLARFPIVERWNDVGSPADLERARAQARAATRG